MIARSIDLKLSAYHAAVLTVAESSALREGFDLARIERLARRVGDVFGGWFVITSEDQQVFQLMNTLTPEGTLFGPYPRTDRPELIRAEDESLHLSRSVTSDAFFGRLASELIVSTVTAITLPDDTTATLGFVTTLNDITAWLMDAELAEGEFAAIADGSHRVIARSHDNENFLLADLPDWYIAFSEGRDSGVAVGAPSHGGAPRLFAMHRLSVAPGWTLAVSQPLPSSLSALYHSAWPALSGLMVLLLSGSIAALSLDRSRARDEAQRAAREVAEREKLLTEVRAADTRKSRLMAVLAHDLRTPLVAMLGCLDLFRPHLDKPPQKKILHRLKADGHGMLTLIDDVLELARLGAGEARLRPEPFAPIALLTQVGDLVRSSAERHGTEVVVQGDDLPLLIGDVASLRRVLLNFATNAVKATRGGSVQLSAMCGSAGTDGRTVTFAVTDTGCGIAPEDIPRLFRDFGMLERDSTRADGTGLGLAICRRLATAMGGEVGVESTLEEGSRFWLRVTLPEADSAISEADSETDAAPAVLAGLKVLVAEDHDIIRQLTCANLARAGMRPTEAADGAIAVELAQAQEFDLILMDLQMPHLDGDEAAVRIRGGGGPSARARIICVTAHQSPEIALMLSDLAFDACVRKPLDVQQLAALMQGIPPSSAAIISLEDFEADNLTQLRAIDGGALLTRTLNGFAADIDTTRSDLAELIAKRDTFKAGRLVHKLVGFGDFLGARTLSSELRKFEDLIRDDDIEVLEGALEWIDNVMAQTRVQVDHLIEKTNLHSGG
ncbi:hybrid sensor histidine kinase/response regulator [Roseinatronobacter sp. NSM]|uniref:hybrid sensor histidine kinase/response regulator n=1 Tax=Roseinatronobacter sp. NSM TaxID=3457785 RepID=UPI0040362A45